MKTLRRSMILAAAILAAVAQPASAAKPPTLWGTTGACKNDFPGGPCTQQSTLVELDPQNGALIKTIGPVGYTVNGLAWDRNGQKLYATTAIGDVKFHGLITIDTRTGAGTPVDRRAVNFGLSGADSPIHTITIDLGGRMVGWYDEPSGPGLSDTFVQIDKRTGVATEFPATGIDTAQNGLSFSEFDILWNIDVPRGPVTSRTQLAYMIDPADGKPLCWRTLNPPTPAALGDFNDENDLYYGLNFDNSDFTTPFKTFIVVVDLHSGTVTTLGRTVDDLHTLAFNRKGKK